MELQISHVCPHCGKPLHVDSDLNVLASRVYEFLEQNGMDVLVLPSIKELGAAEGGFALQKTISICGGMKAFYPIYTHYAARRLYATHH